MSNYIKSEVIYMIFGLIIIGVSIYGIVSAVNDLKERNRRRRIAAARTASLPSSAHTASSRPTTSVGTTETKVLEYFANNPRNMSDNWFRFRFKKVNDNWRAYIERMPDLRGRASDAHSTHRYIDKSINKHYVCRKPMPKNLKDSQNVARVWADNIIEYIATGKEF